MGLAGGLLLGFSMVAAFADWVAVAGGRRRLEYIAKPATLLGLTVWFVAREPVGSSPAAAAFAIGLGFSLIGDVLFMLPGDLFRQGVGAFFVAHLAYIVAFNQGGVLITPPSIVIAGAVALLAAVVLGRVLPALKAQGRSSLRPVVAIYAFVLGITAWSAIVTRFREDWLPLAALLVGAGGIAFLISDSALVVQRFLRRLPGGRLLEHVTYHIAQFCMALGMALHLP